MTAPIDVNEQFALERAGQLARVEDRQAWVDGEVAAGRMRNMGNGNYRVTAGWDANETISLTSTGELLAQHGLDLSTGQAALYSKVPAWHALGNVVPEGVSDIDEVLKLGGLDYQMAKQPVLYRNRVTGALEELPGQFVTDRSDTGKGLGVVGSVYDLMQNRESFEFLQALTGKFGVIWESAGALRDGARTFVSMRLPQDVRIDPDGVNDEILPFVVALNSHDGSGKFEVMVTPWRPVCGNTERFAVRDAVTRWGTRHTPGARDRVAQARETFARSVTYFEHFVEEENALAQTALKIREFEQIIDEVWGQVDEESSKKKQGTRSKLLGELHALHAGNVATLGMTAYAAERTITEYADWKRGVKPRSESLRGNNLAARATAMLEDTTGALKSRAHRQLMLRVR